MKGPIQSVEVSYFVHATEDPQKIAAAVESVFGFVGAPATEELEGHFGNAILTVNHHLTGEDAGSAFASLASKMDSDLKQKLRKEVAEHLDEHSAFYLRLDKQKMIGGRLVLTEADPVRTRVKPRLYLVKGGAASFYAGLLS